jgi:Cu/Ag efflux protein CusF
MRGFIVFVVLVLVAGCGLAYWLNWWHVGTVPSKDDDGKTKYELTVDKDKINEDVKSAKGTIKEEVDKLKSGVQDKGQAPSQSLLVEGTIRAIDSDKHTLTVMNDKDDEIAVKTDESTRIRVGDKDGKLADLKVGDKASVSYETAKGEKTAKSVTVKK